MFYELKKLLDNSYSPYSNYKVSSIVIDKKGNTYKGVNVESSSFGATNCAERNAIQSAVTKGLKIGELKEVHLLAFNSKIKKQSMTTPCGICRQVIFEFSLGEAKIFLYNYANGEKKQTTIKKLLPNAFKKEKLIV